MPTDPLSGFKPISAAELASMDLETALMAVQTQRADLLEVGLKEQMDAVRQRNNEIANCNAILTALNGRRPSGEDESYMYEVEKTGTGLNIALTAKDLPGTTPPMTMQEALTAQGLSDQFSTEKLTSEEFDTIIQSVKSRIDTLNNSQQQDMLRLQSLMNKRNEAYELMTNFIKKMQDSRSSILSNMR